VFTQNSFFLLALQYDTIVFSLVQSRTIREFDSKFTCKAFGYSDTNEYYSDASLHTKLHQFQIPTLCLSAADDPFQPLEGMLFLL